MLSLVHDMYYESTQDKGVEGYRALLLEVSYIGCGISHVAVMITLYTFKCFVERTGDGQ